MSSLNWLLDDQGLPLHKGDAGDCAARAFQMCVAEEILRKLCLPTQFDLNYYYHCRDLLIRDGCVLRYNRPGPNGQPYNDPYDKEWGTSRDQTVPAILAAWLMGDVATLFKIYQNVKGNWFRFPNKDLMGPDVWMMCNKAMGQRPFGLWLGEKHVQVNAWWRCRQAEKNGDDVGDDILEIQELATLRMMGTDQYAVEAIKYYSNHRPCFKYIGGPRTDASSYQKINGNGVQWALDHYNDDGANPHNEHWRPIVNALFSFNSEYF